MTSRGSAMSFVIWHRAKRDAQQQLRLSSDPRLNSSLRQFADPMSAKFQSKSTAALWALGLIPAEDLPDIAVDAMMQGHDSKALVELAGLTRHELEDAPKLFARALEGMGEGRMDKPEALRRYACMVSASILASEVTPYDGARRLWRAQLDAEIPHSHELDPFVYAASEMEDRPEDKAFFESAIREEAKRWVETGTGSIPA